MTLRVKSHLIKRKYNSPEEKSLKTKINPAKKNKMKQNKKESPQIPCPKIWENNQVFNNFLNDIKV